MFDFMFSVLEGLALGILAALAMGGLVIVSNFFEGISERKQEARHIAFMKAHQN